MSESTIFFDPDGNPLRGDLMAQHTAYCWHAEQATALRETLSRDGELFTVSTSYLGINTQPQADRPLVWETMSFAPNGVNVVMRYPNTDAAAEGHVLIVAELVRAGAVIVETPDRYTCPRCGMSSSNPNDLQNRYCGRCHRFEDIFGEGEPIDAEPAAAERDETP